MDLTMTRFEAIPFTPTPERASVVSKIMRELLKFETIFTDYQRGCDEACGDCDACVTCMNVIAYILSHPQSRAWEVWAMGEDAPEIVGMLMVTNVVSGVDAEAHYAFFDGKLKGKETILESMLEWVFEDHEDWLGLRRITVAIPDFAYALAKHAQRHLGFGGDFVLSLNGKTLNVEGVRRKAFLWRGVDRDMILMGRVR